MKYGQKCSTLVDDQHQSHEAVPKNTISKTADCFEEISDEDIVAGSIECDT